MKEIHQVVEVTQDCEVGDRGERAVIVALDHKSMVLIFPARPRAERRVSTGVDYSFLRAV